MKWLALVCLWALPCALWAQGVFNAPVSESADRRAALEQLADRLRGQLPISARISQRKHLAALEKPLVSEGHFQLAADGELRWHIETPFAMTYHYRDGTLTRRMDGQRESVAPADEPALYGFFQVFGRLLQMDLAQLGDYFTPHFVSEPDGWTLGLTPVDGRLKKALAQIVVRGEGAQVRSVVLTQPGDDYTQLTFRYPDTGDAQ